MAEQEKKPATAVRKKNYRFGNRAGQSGPKSIFKSNVIGLEEDTPSKVQQIVEKH